MDQRSAAALVVLHRRDLIRAWYEAKETSFSSDLMAVLRVSPDSSTLEVKTRGEMLKLFPRNTISKIADVPASEAGSIAEGVCSLWVVVVRLGDGAACLRWSEPYLEEEYLLQKMG